MPQAEIPASATKPLQAFICAALRPAREKTTGKQFA
jgi:hypothetical protein